MGSVTRTQFLSSNVALTSASILGGAEAVNAMKGAVVSALSPPNFLNEVLNFSPLLTNVGQSCIIINTQTNHSNMQCASSIATIAILHSLNKFLQGLVIAVSGDMKTEVIL